MVRLYWWGEGGYKHKRFRNRLKQLRDGDDLGPSLQTGDVGICVCGGDYTVSRFSYIAFTTHTVPNARWLKRCTSNTQSSSGLHMLEGLDREVQLRKLDEVRLIILLFILYIFFAISVCRENRAYFFLSFLFSPRPTSFRFIFTKVQGAYSLMFC